MTTRLRDRGAGVSMPHGKESHGFWRDAYEDMKRAADADVERLTVERDHYRVGVNNLTAEVKALRAEVAALTPAAVPRCTTEGES